MTPRSATIVLASVSPRRLALLHAAGIEADAVASGVIEDARPGERVQDQVRRLAEAKARAVAVRHRARFFIGADTIVVRRGETFGKPRDDADAARMLHALSGGAHDVVTGYAVYDAAAERVQGGAVETRVYFKTLSPEEVAAYVATGAPRDKAGAYGIQDRAAYMVSRIEGSYTSVVGLPLCETVEALVRIGAIACAGRKD